MTVAAYASGTQTATVTTEHTLSAPNAVGVYTLHVDTTAMAAGDVLELRVYQMILYDGGARGAYFMAYYGVQPVDDAIKISVPIANELIVSNSLMFTLKQTFGTGRAYPWKVLSY